MRRPKATRETKSHQQHVLMTPSEVKAIDDWRFANRIGSRGEAIRNLCAMALTVDKQIDELWDLSKENQLSAMELEMKLAQFGAKSEAAAKLVVELLPGLEAVNVDAVRVGHALRSLVSTSTAYRQDTFTAATAELAVAEAERDRIRAKYADLFVPAEPPTENQ